MSTPDADAMFDAMQATIEAAISLTGAQWRVFDYGTVPTPLPRVYFLLSVEPMANPVGRRMSGDDAPKNLWRITVRQCAKEPSEARWAMGRTDIALRGVRVPVDGGVTTPIRFERAQAPEPTDDRRSEGLSSWTCSL
ncbi:hypothetical protein [Nocardioides bruguierae]|uniref:Uncharacterized protein n=1 Tax=Nocardioides bruguierae TaxID=2945102 RepID=A0A9X2IGU1_9ACTN|nr:hypothetical protein [Nocardioides bruguierae]MCM0622717.1 hypothetical protein [Nocardioides bruguierae]